HRARPARRPGALPGRRPAAPRDCRPPGGAGPGAARPRPRGGRRRPGGGRGGPPGQRRRGGAGAGAARGLRPAAKGRLMLELTPIRGLVGEPAPRPDGPAKVRGSFDFASDLRAEGMLYGRTVRSPHPHAVVRAIDVAAAAALPGVRAVLTAADIPGKRLYGL